MAATELLRQRSGRSPNGLCLRKIRSVHAHDPSIEILDKV
jgi:hypothetical protein